MIETTRARLWLWHHHDPLARNARRRGIFITTKTTNESRWLVGVSFSSSLPFVDHHNHQRVNMTCWCVVLVVLMTTTTTNESRWLVGCCSHPFVNYNTTRSCVVLLLPTPRRLPQPPVSHYDSFSSSVPLVDYPDHQRVIMTRWCVVPILFALHQPPTSHYASDSLASSPPVIVYHEHQRVITCWCIILLYYWLVFNLV